MEEPVEQELKQEFQLERMIFFSDAVFAIAITILALELKVPAIDRHIATDAMLLNSLDELIPKFVGFFISFFIIGLYWTIHHRMFGYVVRYNKRLLWLNLIFLLAIVLMPFSTAFYSEYVIELLRVPMMVYATNIVFLGLMNIILWRYLTQSKNGLTEGVRADDRKYYLFRAMVVPVLFVSIAVIYLFNPKVAIFLPMFVPVVLRLAKRFVLKRK